jgi:DnaJ-class molecular chaperone
MYLFNLFSNDYYKILGITANSTNNDIKKAYKKLSLRWHPDKNKLNKELTTEYFKKITNVYSTLIDSNKRNLYNTTIYNDILFIKSLRKKCCYNGLKMSGTKDELIQRLLNK